MTNRFKLLTIIVLCLGAISCGNSTPAVLVHNVNNPYWNAKSDLLVYSKKIEGADPEIWIFNPQLLKSHPSKAVKTTKPQPHPHQPATQRSDRKDPLHHSRSARYIKSGATSPDASALAYLKKGNVIIRNLNNGSDLHVTTQGTTDHVYGRPDWVYTEELRQTRGLWWSPNSAFLAFYETDTRPIEKHTFKKSQKGRKTYSQRYPYSGRPNSIVRLHLFNQQTKKSQKLDLNSERDCYLIQPTWSHDSRYFYVVEINRLQNRRRLIAWDTQTHKVSTLKEETSKTFINADQVFRPLKSGNILWGHEDNDWRDLELIYPNGTRKSVVESSNDIHRVLNVDETTGSIMYTAWTELGRELHLFQGNLDGRRPSRITHEPGVHHVALSPSGRFILDSHSSFNRPRTTVLLNASGKTICTLATANANVKPPSNIPHPTWFSFLAADNATRLSGVMYRPTDYDPKKSYPLLVSVYGGPHSRVLRNEQMTGGSLQAMANHGLIVAKFDNRGLRGRGKKFESTTYLKNGQMDLDDQAAGVRYLTSRQDVNGSRVGITGHSYGGYMSCLALARFPMLFHLGLAGAPVTDWRFYDTAYTERYMRTPNLNPEGYQLSSVVNLADRIKGHLLIGHGGSDDNVHIENSLELIKALGTNPKITFEIYPDSFHGFTPKDKSHFKKLRMKLIRQHLLAR